MSPRALRNAVASALIAELHNRELAKTLRQVSQRQVMLANALARVHGLQTKAVLPEVRKQWYKVMGTVPSSSQIGERMFAGMAAENRAWGIE